MLIILLSNCSSALIVARAKYMKLLGHVLCLAVEARFSSVLVFCTASRSLLVLGLFAVGVASGLLVLHVFDCGFAVWVMRTGFYCLRRFAYHQVVSSTVAHLIGFVVISCRISNFEVWQFLQSTRILKHIAGLPRSLKIPESPGIREKKFHSLESP